MHSAYKSSTRSLSIGFLFGCDSNCFFICMASNEELQKTLQTLSTGIKSIQNELTTLKHRPYKMAQACSSQDLACNSAAQILPLPPQKRTKLEDDEVISNDKVEDNDALQGPLVPISEAVAAFLEAAFSMKLDNNARKVKVKADCIPDLRWIQYAKLDSVVSANVLATVRATESIYLHSKFLVRHSDPSYFPFEEGRRTGVTSRSHC